MMSLPTRDKWTQGLGVASTLLEECRVILDQVDFVGEAFGKDVGVPYWAKSAVGGLDFMTELTDCALRDHGNEVKLMMCPMKYASAFTDLISGIDNIFGVDNGEGGEAFWGRPTTTPPPPPPPFVPGPPGTGGWGAAGPPSYP
jgi:hypothetical protein